MPDTIEPDTTTGNGESPNSESATDAPDKNLSPVTEDLRLSSQPRRSAEGVTPPDTPEDTEPDTFPREVVEKLRQENGKYRQRAQQADAYAQRLHTALVAATGRLADPTDLPFDADHLDDDGANLTAAIDALLERKPHLASRTPVGDVGQGPRGTSSEPFSLLSLLKSRT